jgi:hypothetical protein
MIMHQEIVQMKNFNDCINNFQPEKSYLLHELSMHASNQRIGFFDFKHHTPVRHPLNQFSSCNFFMNLPSTIKITIIIVLIMIIINYSLLSFC